MKKQFTLLLAVSLMAFITITDSTLAQSISWSSRYATSGDNTDHFQDMEGYNGNGFIATGFSVKKGNYKDVLVTRLTQTGDTLWWRTKNGDGNSNDEGVSIAADFFGNIYVAGTTDNGNNQDDIYLIKYDANGTLLWDTTWNSPSYLDDEAVEMMLDGSGNILVVGNVEPDELPGSSNIVALKFSPNGGLLWQYVFDNTTVLGGKDEVASMSLD
ncbi:MAG: SBBP repeat-containing protein, partial [Bacteroidota bacterium]